MRNTACAIGIDVGSMSVKISLLDAEKAVLCHVCKEHKGRPYAILAEEIASLTDRYKLHSLRCGALTGIGGAKLSQDGSFKAYSEVLAQCKALEKYFPLAGTIIELGCQNAKFIVLHPDRSIKHFSLNTDCSSGTGSFLEEQAFRLGIDLHALSALTESALSIPRIAGRCSVFSKTDIVHLQQEGTSVNEIILGLCYAVIRTFKASVVRSAEVAMPLFFHGGMAENKGIIRAVQDLFSLHADGFFIPAESRNINSTGVALLALANGDKFCLNKLKKALEQKQKQIGTTYHRSLDLPVTIDPLGLHKSVAYAGDCYLGIDVGSTSTNLVLMSPAGRIVDSLYLHTKGNPIAVVQEGMRKFKRLHRDKLILGVGVTGSGRYSTADLVGGDVVKDEITAQARAAFETNPEVDTVFEIGGQDAKFIRLNHGAVTDFEMNKVCAAGTGSFLEEQAKKMGVPVEEIAPLALRSGSPVSLGERCTVYMETNVRHYLTQGTPLQDIMAGLCYAVAQNYLNRVVGGKKIGCRICFQGGVAFNQGVLAALQSIIGQQIQVSPFFSVTGAWGAALLAREEMHGKNVSSNFRGWETEMDGCQLTKIVCQGCANVCQVKKVDFRPGEAKYYGARCEIFEKGTEKKTEEKLPPLFALREEFFMKDYQGELNPDVPTIGIPRVLFMYKLFPMFQAMFHHLGFNVVISDHTDERIIALSESCTFEETCYPVKLITGHLLDLIEKKVSYIFLPSLATMKHPTSRSRQDYPCIFMQSVAAIMEVLLGSKLQKENIKLISPVLSFKFGRQYLLKTFLRMGAELGKKPVQILPAIKKGFMAKDAFEQAVEKKGRDFLQSLSPQEKVLVLITRPYGIIDRHLNMRIPQELAKVGIKIIPKDALPISDYDISKFSNNMYWPFGQHILAAAQIVKESSNLYAVFLTNHGCGPDTALVHYVSEIMGDKPYLHLEVDEHSSPVGIITRLEAFVNSLHNYQPKQENAILPEGILSSSISDKKQLFIPDLGPHAEVVVTTLGQFGYNAKLLEPPHAENVEVGCSFTITKEYFSLTGLLGSVAATLKKEKENLDKIAILVPTLEGAEVDGQYARLLKTILSKNAMPQVEVLAPYLEDLFSEKSPFGSALAAKFFRMVLAVDILFGMLLETRPYTDNPAQANQLFAEYVQQLPFTQDIRATIVAAGLDFERLVTHSKNRPVLAIVGEPYLLYRPELNANLIERAEQLGAEIKLPPLAEIICHYFLEKQAEAKTKKEFFGYLKYRAVLGKLFAEAEKVSPGAGSRLQDQVEKISCCSRKYFSFLSGGFGTYRIGKGMVAHEEGARGIINVASLYENTGLLVNIFSDRLSLEDGVAWLNVGIDGKKNENDEVRLQAFVQNLLQKRICNVDDVAIDLWVKIKK